MLATTVTNFFLLSGLELLLGFGENALLSSAPFQYWRMAEPFAEDPCMHGMLQ